MKNPTNFSIRMLSEADAHTFLQLRSRAVLEEPEIFAMSYEEFADTSLETAANLLKATDDSFVLGAFTDTLVGLVEFHRRSFRKLRHLGLVSGMYVAPELRRNGIGRALMQELFSKVTLLSDVEGLVLIVASTDQPAVSLYASCGFTTYGVEPMSLKLGDIYIDGQHMMAPLPARAACA